MASTPNLLGTVPKGLSPQRSPPNPQLLRHTAHAGFGALLFSLALAFAAPTVAQQVHARIVMQSSPLAGFRHYEAPTLWGEVQPGDALTLVREPDNPHDRNAVRVEWRTFKLGYVPRAENAGIARQIDHGTPLVARVSKVQLTRAPNKRIEFEIYLPL